MQDLLARIHELEETVARMQNSPAVGIVSSARNDPVLGPVVRLTLPDQDGKVTGEVQVAQRSCLGISDYHLPRPGERMLLHKMHNGPEGAIAHGAMYSISTTTPPQQNDQNHHTTWDDGSTMTVTPGGKGKGGMNLVCTTQITVDVNGGITVTTGGAISITAGGAVTVTAAGTVTVTAPLINANGVQIDNGGNVTIPGTLTVKGNVIFKAQGTIATHLTNEDGAGGGS
jgi:phage baseplate assembly protein gpV